MPAEPMIRLDQVTKLYPGTEAPAVDRLSIDIAEGQIVILVGPSGCGKTTTLKMINRLIAPTSGRVMVAGQDTSAVEAHVLRRSIGYVIQQIGLFPHRTIAENIATVPRLLGWDTTRIGQRVDELIDLVALDHEMRDRYPAELSGGERQRVGGARALAADPPVLLMDEPFGAVDPIVRARLQDELLDLQQRVRKTIVLVTHDIDEAIRLGDRVAILNVGGILEQYEAPADILRDPANPFVKDFLGADRGIKRLSLIPIASLDLEPGPVIELTDDAAAARRAMARYGVDWFAIRSDDRLLGWAWERELGNRRPADTPLKPFEAKLDYRASLREALDTVITSHTKVAPVFEGDRFLGMLTIDEINREVVG